MPLKPGSSKETIHHNISVEMAAGKKYKQALVIALSHAHYKKKRT